MTEEQVNTVIQDEVELYSESVSEQFNNIKESLTTFKTSINAFQTQIKFLEKGVKKELKIVKSKIKKKSSIKRKPSGFAVPSLISDELCKFMEKEPNTKIARTEVTKFIIQYIKDNSLQYTENKKIIIPDKKLSKLLAVENQDEIVITYFNIQRYMNRHFIKTT